MLVLTVADADSVGVVVVVGGVVVVVGCLLMADATSESHPRSKGFGVGVWGAGR